MTVEITANSALVQGINFLAVMTYDSLRILQNSIYYKLQICFLKNNSKQCISAGNQFFGL